MEGEWLIRRREGRKKERGLRREGGRVKGSEKLSQLICTES